MFILRSAFWLTIAFVAMKGDSRDIYVRRIDALTPRPLPGTTGGLHPFFSPDGRRLAFFANGQLRVTEIEGGVPHVVCPAGDARGGTWGEDDVIVFAAAPETALSRVPAAGGNPAPFSVLGPGELSHRFPHDLPGGARRLVQRADGYLATIVSGKVIARDGELTDELPGRIVRGAQQPKR